ncbi:MAG TPA: flagellar protein FliT [Polaromonas sp.]|uniref:flagellar protein FliT n=1 Tax=Polaromonas sp. UBA4122 TaxID=1947074 RepID=UPI000EDC9E08|nr:flagellar protein FliT [Polaromonas sp. UBA4122]HAL37230.1 flagellar protein FliT [Polaromonas sp.]
MSSQSEVMHCYEQTATVTERMLMLARGKQWGELPALETQYSDTVDRLKAIEPQETLDESQSARKHGLLSRIISNHDEILSVVMPQLAMLGEALKSLALQQSLHKAYGQTDDAPLWAASRH